MSLTRAPKQWSLSENETITTFESWRANLTYILSLDSNFAPFLADNTSWQKKSTANPHRGFEDDAPPVPEGQRKTVVQKVTLFELMLG